MNKVMGKRFKRLFTIKTRWEAFLVIYAIALGAVPLLPAIRGERMVTHCNDLFDRQVVFFGEREIALVVAGHTHHGAVAVAHQHVVAHPQRHRLAGERVRDGKPQRQAFLLLQRQFRFGGAAALALLDEGGHLRVALRRVRGQRVLGLER